MDKKATKVNSISVYLIKAGDYVRFKDLVAGGLTTKPIDVDGGQLFYKVAKKEYCPSWVDGFFGVEKLGKNRKKLCMKTLSAVYFTTIRHKGKTITFAIVFGNGRYLIKKEWIQHGFGLVTSSHAIDTSRISSMRTTTYDSSIKDKVIRSVIEIRQSDFFLNADTDVLTAISGKVRSEKTGELLKDRTIGGKDSVSMTAHVDVNNLKDFLIQLYDQYVSEGKEGVRYKGNINKLVSDSDIAIAETLLQNAIDNRSKGENLYLNLPMDELEDKDKVMGYTIGDTKYEELTLDILDSYPTIDALRNTTVKIIGENGEEDEDGWNIDCQLYEFLYAELESDARCYILSNGTFYSITKGYKKRVDEFYKNVRIESFPVLTTWDGGDEGSFNKEQKSDDVLVMDEKFVYPEGRDRFEVCDLLTKDKHLIHVKIFKAASQPLGHLFNQGMLSAQCIADNDIRPLVQDKIEKVQKLGKKKNDFSIQLGFAPEDYTVTFLLLCSEGTKYEKDGRPKIPFMARAVFREQFLTIKGLGFNVTLASMNSV